jgi:PhnB protein
MKKVTITPYLYYEDVGAALKWLREALGFEETGERKTERGVIKHAGVKLGDGVILLGHPGPHYRSPRRLGQSTQCLCVLVDDLETHFQKARKAGANIIEEPTNTDYGERRYGVVDPEGHEWYISQPLAR